jgi:hypothetical protein
MRIERKKGRSVEDLPLVLVSDIQFYNMLIFQQFQDYLVAGSLGNLDHIHTAAQ